MYRCIVVGTDGSDTARAAVDHAFRLAQVVGAQVHVVSAWTVNGAWSGVAAGQLTPAPLAQGDWVREVLDGAAARGTELGLDVQTHSVEAAPVQALLDVARAMGADLVVTGNRGMTGLRGMLGSVPNSLAHRSPCAVLVVPTS